MNSFKFMTLDNFYDFLVSKNQSLKFSKNESGLSFIVGLDGNLTFNKETLKDGLTSVHLKAAHVGRNKNQSKISEKSMKNNLNSIKNRPILAYIHQIEIDGEMKNVFGWHAMHEDDDGNTVYDEIPCGHVPSDAKPSLVYDKDADKEYIEVDAFLYEEYTKAVEILEDADGQCPVSVEIDVNDFSYDAKERLLSIDDFTFKGITILGYYEDGTEVQPAMEGANITMLNFNMSQSSFEINQNSMKGGNEEMNLFEQLLEKYNVTSEDVTFEYENLTDEELITKFEEVFGSTEEDTSDSTPESNFDEDNNSSEDEEVDEVNKTEEMENDSSENEQEETFTESKIETETKEESVDNAIVYSVNGKEYSVSLNDKIYALTSLVNDAYSESDNAYYSVIVYEKELVMVDTWVGTAYRQSYSERSGVFSLKGDRVPVHAIYVTDTEEQKLDDIRSRFSTISTELKKYQDAEEKVNKENIINSSEWNLIADNEEFINIKEHFAEYSVEDLQNKCNQILLDCVKKNSVKTSNVPKDTGYGRNTFNVFRFPENNTVENKRYGNLFD